MSSMECSQELGALQNSTINLQMLSSTISHKNGYSHKLERDVRIMACNMIDSASILLDLPQLTSATAQSLTQRYYFMVSIGQYPLINVMGAALYLACKLEENPRRLRDIITVLDYLRKKANRQPETPLDISTNVFILANLMLIYLYFLDLFFPQRRSFRS